MIEEEVCYLFKPDDVEESNEPPRKRNKTAHVQVDDEDLFQLFPPLLHGFETAESIRSRSSAFERFWAPREDGVQQFLNDAHSQTKKSVTKFIAESRAKGPCQIPTALIIHDSSNGTSAALGDAVLKEVAESNLAMCIPLLPSPNSNLKALLKTINRAARTDIGINGLKSTQENSEDRYLNYDLQQLLDYIVASGTERVVLLFQDSEAFDGSLLSDVVDILSTWNDRIPFIILFSIRTSVSIFQMKFSRNAIALLGFQVFEVESVGQADIFRLLVQQSSIYLSSGTAKMLLDRQEMGISSPSALVRTLKYCYMAHFFSNQLSTWATDKNRSLLKNQKHLQAIQQTASFRRFIEHLLQAREESLARKFLLGHSWPVDHFLTELEKTENALSRLLSAVDLLSFIHSFLLKNIGKVALTWPELYILAISDKLADSTFLSDVLSMIQRMEAHITLNFLDQLIDRKTLGDFKSILDKLQRLLDGRPDDSPLRSVYDPEHSNLRTTVVAQRVKLTKPTTEVSSEESTYTKIIDSMTESLSQVFEKSLINPQELFLHEAYIYDGRLQLRETFMPRPRHAVERALSSPHDYLGCECCAGNETSLSASQPPIAILYQLYLESGSVINAADLWSAYWTIVKPEDGERDVTTEETKALASFSRALAELQYLSMIKNSRKKADHLTKLLWKGL